MSRFPAAWVLGDSIYTDAPLVGPSSGSFSRIEGGGGYAGPYLAKAAEFGAPLLSWPGKAHWHVGLETLTLDMLLRRGPALRIPTLQLSGWREPEVRGARGPDIGLIGTPGADLDAYGWVNAIGIEYLRLLNCEGVLRFTNASDFRFQGPVIECPWRLEDRTPGVPRTTLLLEGPPTGWKYRLLTHGSVADAHMENGELHVRRLQRFVLERGYYHVSRVVIEDVQEPDVDSALDHGIWGDASELWVNGERLYPGAAARRRWWQVLWPWRSS